MDGRKYLPLRMLSEHPGGDPVRDQGRIVNGRASAKGRRSS